jgi:hypothetical protein
VAAKAKKPKNAAYVATDKDRDLVKAMAAIGVDQDDMARLLRITSKTMRKHFRDELDLGLIQANAAVGGAMFKAAVTPGPGQVTAGIWWTKCRMGWREPTQKHEHTGQDGKPIEVRQITRVIVDPRATDPASKANKKAEAGTEGKAGTEADKAKN